VDAISRVDERAGDVDYISHTISTVQEFMVRQIVRPYLTPWFTLSGELREREEMRDRGNEIMLTYIRDRRKHPASTTICCRSSSSLW